MATRRNFRANRSRSQRGETLVESLIAITILSIVTITVLTGVRTALKASVLHHEMSTAETLLRSSAEEIQNPDRPYVPLAGCPDHDTYVGLPTRPRFSPVTATVEFWDPSSTPMAARAAVHDGVPAETIHFDSHGSCPSVDLGLQRITLQLTTPSGYLQTLTVMKRQP